MKTTNKIFLVIFLIQLIFSAEIMAKPRIVGYYPDWEHGWFSHEKIQFENLTDIVHAFIWPNPDGSLVVSEYYNYPELIDRARETGTNVLAALGGWGQSDNFSPMAANPAARLNFIQNLIDFCQTYDYQGVDFDWEYPQTPADRTNLTTLVKELRTAFDAVDSTLLITMAVPAGAWSEIRFDYKTLQNYLDWFGCMTYDFHESWTSHAGHNAPLYAPINEAEGSADLSIRYLISLGIPRSKILLGIPFYGRQFNAVALYAPATGGSEVQYRQINAYLNSGWEYHWDDLSKVPYLTDPNQTKLITFDDTASVRIKTEYALEKELGGVMIWAIGQDYSDDQQPLLESIAKASQFPARVVSRESGKPEHFVLQNNYPNPFNGSTVIRYYLKNSARIKLEIINLLGQQIQVLKDTEETPGCHQVQFNAQNLVSGIYYYRLSAPNFCKTGKMIYVP